MASHSQLLEDLKQAFRPQEDDAEGEARRVRSLQVLHDTGCDGIAVDEWASSCESRIVILSHATCSIPSASTCSTVTKGGLASARALQKKRPASRVNQRMFILVASTDCEVVLSFAR